MHSSGCFLTCGRIPAWKRLIDHPLSTTERISLITYILSERDETEVVKHLRGNDAQAFIDVVDEVIARFLYFRRLRQVEKISPTDIR